MGFNLYLAGGDSVPLDLKKDDNVGILTTFADGPTAVKKFIDKRHCKTFCDSGAYGVAHSGKKIDIDEYIKFINNTPECDVFAVLDEIPWTDGQKNDALYKQTAEGTWKNYIYMIEHVKPEYLDKLVCAFHWGEPIEYLHKIIDGYKGYKPKYIALGGRAGVSTAILYNYLDNKFWPAIRNSSNPDIKIHAFGVTVFEMLERYRWYSADSTTWLRTGIAGNIHTRCKGMKVVNISDRRTEKGKPLLKTGIGALNNIRHITQEQRDRIMQEIEAYGFNFEELVTDYKKRHEWNCLYYKEWADNYKYKPTKIIRQHSLF